MKNKENPKKLSVFWAQKFRTRREISVFAKPCKISKRSLKGAKSRCFGGCEFRNLNYSNFSKVKIGLEVHVPLNTKSKLFCSCQAVPEKPNTNVCEICLGMPGSKPCLNKKALEIAIGLAIALKSNLSKTILFVRKTYFYPDLPKKYQITQYENPVAVNGKLKILNKIIPLTRIQLEEDPGSIYHKEDRALIDFNRSGIPLIEIVTEPKFENSKEVLDFLQRLSSILDYLEIYNSKDFSIRTDINISTIGEKVEIKNVSGSKNIEKAINFETIRQNLLSQRGEKIEQRTMHFDKETEKTFPSRTKESEEDYGYILEPDLPIIELSKEEILRIKKSIPELPLEKIERFEKQYDLNSDEAYVITIEKEIADLYESLYDKVNSSFLKNWISVSLKKVLNYNNKKFSETKIEVSQIEKLIKKVTSKELTPRSAEFVLRELVNTPSEISIILEKLNISKTSNEELNSLIEKTIRENRKAVEDYKNGKEKSLHFLIGQIVKATNGKADAKIVKELIIERIK